MKATQWQRHSLEAGLEEANQAELRQAYAAKNPSLTLLAAVDVAAAFDELGNEADAGRLLLPAAPNVTL